MKLMVLDGNSLVNRAFFGIKLLTTKDGRYTNAIYGFQNILLNLLAAHKPDAVAIAWDERAPTFRHNAYDGYKATRHGMPEELAQQMPVLKELLTDLGFVQVSKAGWEADDILGTLAAACEAAGGTTLLATGDRDSLQLVDDATTVLLATNKETIPMDPAAIREKYGIEPPQLIDVKSLMGDASDNIPGVPGIGEKTALALISKFGSLQGVYDNIEDKAVKPGQRAKLTANRDKADLSYMLGTIRKDAPIESDPAAYVRQPGDPAAAAQLLAALEMHKMVARWGLEDGAAPAAADAAPLETVEPSPLPLLLEGRFYAARNADGMVVMYADTITPSMRRAIDETERRREKQDAFNKAHGIVPRTVIKSVRELLEISATSEDVASNQRQGRVKAMTRQEKAAEIARLEKAMKEAAKMLEFELAATLRDQIIELRGK